MNARHPARSEDRPSSVPRPGTPPN
jgi:hypothetical protein